MIRRAAIGARIARRSLVVKLVSDEVFERETRSGRYEGALDEFQQVGGGTRIRFLRATRNAALRGARHVFCRSAYLRNVALSWGLKGDRAFVLPNPAPKIPQLPSHEELRAELGLDGPAPVFAGRVGPQKALGVALAALADAPDVSLTVAGDGPQRAALERQASARLLVPPGDARALATAISRFFSAGELASRLVGAAPESVGAFSEEAVFTAIEAELERAPR